MFFFFKLMQKSFLRMFAQKILHVCLLKAELSSRRNQKFSANIDGPKTDGLKKNEERETTKKY